MVGMKQRPKLRWHHRSKTQAFGQAEAPELCGEGVTGRGWFGGAGRVVVGWWPRGGDVDDLCLAEALPLDALEQPVRIGS